MLKINSEYIKGILFVRIDGNLNRRNSHKLNNFLVPAVLKHKIKFLVYNLYNLNNIDIVGKDALLKGARAIDANNGISLMCEVPNNLDLNDLDINRTKNELTAIDMIKI